MRALRIDGSVQSDPSLSPEWYMNEGQAGVRLLHIMSTSFALPLLPQEQTLDSTYSLNCEAFKGPLTFIEGGRIIQRRVDSLAFRSDLIVIDCKLQITRLNLHEDRRTSSDLA